MRSPSNTNRIAHGPHKHFTFSNILYYTRVSKLSLLRQVFWNDSEARPRLPWRLLLAVLLFIPGILVGLTIVLVGLGLLSHTNAIFTTDLGLLIGTIGVGLGMTGSLWLIARWIDKRSFRNFGLHVNLQWKFDLIAGLLLGAGVQTVIFGVGVGAGWYQINGFFKVNGELPSSFLAVFFMLIVVFVIVGIYEELLVRGWLLTNLAEGFSRYGTVTALGIATGVSSTLFGIMHLLNPGASIIAAVVITLAGLFLALGYVFTGQLGFPIGVHITWNFFQGPIFGKPVSGLTVPATVIETQSVGPNWITGGAFGPEAGVLGIFGIVIGMLGLGIWIKLQHDGQCYPRIADPQQRQ